MKALKNLMMMKFSQLILFLFVNSSCYLSTTLTAAAAADSSFPLTLAKVPTNYKTSSSVFNNKLLSSEDIAAGPPTDYQRSLEYTMVLVATIPIGTGPEQPMNMVMDTGSEISWLRCANRSSNLTTMPEVFVPYKSKSFSEFTCKNLSDCVTDSSNMVCARPHDYPKAHRRCHFSFNYVDHFHVEGDLIKETVTLSDSIHQRIILACASMIDPSRASGIMGMNLGNLSFTTQANITKFSYCVPPHFNNITKPDLKYPYPSPPTGKFYQGSNPNSHGFQYVQLWDSQDRPSIIDKFAYRVLLRNIHIGKDCLKVPDEIGLQGGGCPMMIDSASQYSFLLQSTYGMLREKVAKLTTGFNLTTADSDQPFDMCFLNKTVPEHIYSKIGDLMFEFENDVTITIPKERVLDYINGTLCVTIGQPDMSNDASTHLLGIHHQQCYWVEYDSLQKRVGFGKIESCEQGNSCG